MPELSPKMRWWGWGVDGHDKPLSGAVEKILNSEFRIDQERVDPVALADVQLAASRLNPTSRSAFAEIVGEANVFDDRLSRISHAVGRSYPDLVQVRSGRLEAAPDLVVLPGDSADVAAVLKLCDDEKIAVVPFGGGTSVVGGVAPGAGAFKAIISLDLTRLNRLLWVDRTSLVATFEPGLTGPQVETALAAHDLTLGHFPQSFEFATVGGWAATRSAGQASTGYGRIEDLIVGLRCITPRGEIHTLIRPASAAGPDLAELITGSEGVLGVITEVSVRVRPQPPVKRYEAWSFSTFDEGIDALRQIEQNGASADIARLSDHEETRLSLAIASTGSVAERALTTYLRARGQSGGCLVIVGWEGSGDSVRHRRTQTRSKLREAGGIKLGSKIGIAWERGRFKAPYLRDELLARGIFVETLETATTWSNLRHLYSDLSAALHAAFLPDGGCAVMCHISHLYPTGASLYFTFIAKQSATDPIAQWRRAKSAACDAIVAAGGTITHHHAVGRDHAPWLEREVGSLGIELLTASKQRLDPNGIMNPGKLIGLPGDDTS